MGLHREAYRISFTNPAEIIAPLKKSPFPASPVAVNRVKAFLSFEILYYCICILLFILPSNETLIL